MKYKHLQQKKREQHYLFSPENSSFIAGGKHLFMREASVLGSMILCLLLSACSFMGNGTTNQSTTSILPTAPAISSTLQNQGEMQLQTFQQWITLDKQYGGDTGPYNAQYKSDQQALKTAKTAATYKSALSNLSAHIDAVKLPVLKIEGQNLQQKLKQEVTSWGQQHTYHDDFNNTTYPLGFEYGDAGIGSWVQDDLTSAKTVADYQQAIENENMYLTHFQAMMTNFSDKTPYNQVHNSDLQLIQHAGKMNGKVVVVSLSEQAMRVYDHGKLVHAFLVTTGRPDRPSIPGDWWIEGKQSPTIFSAGVPRSDPGWYPDTPINFAMQYHSQGYFLHDSWWRNDYGPQTNFPHADSSGDPFSSQGSHGCVNLSKADAAVLYSFVELYTGVIIF